MQILCHESGCGCDLPRDQGRYTALFLLNTQLVLFSLASPYTNTNTHNLIRSLGNMNFFVNYAMEIYNEIDIGKKLTIIKDDHQRSYLQLIIILRFRRSRFRGQRTISSPSTPSLPRARRKPASKDSRCLTTKQFLTYLDIIWRLYVDV